MAIAQGKLDELLLKADVGVDSLARHRVNNFENNSLKSKEYLTFGLPIVKSHRDHSIDSCEYFSMSRAMSLILKLMIF